jgi:3-hydroxybutyryl-CoA dehydrogenase
METNIKTVTVVGAGMMGVKISARSLISGFTLRLFDILPGALESAKNKVRAEVEAYCQGGLTKEDPEIILQRISFHSDLKKAVADTDLIIEAITEKLDLKKEVFSQLDQIAPAHTIIGTNSSSIPISKIEEAVSRKDKVANIHFYLALVITSPFVDLMRGTQTSNETFAKCKTWIEAIGCIALIVKKECMGFVFNRIWHAVKREALASWAGGHADYKDIDRAWKLWSGMPAGPFGMMDVVGLDVVYDIEMTYYLNSKDPKDTPPDALKAMIERGELGLKSGKGFYDWSDPEFLKPEFTKPPNSHS